MGLAASLALYSPSFGGGDGDCKNDVQQLSCIIVTALDRQRYSYLPRWNCNFVATSNLQRGRYTVERLISGLIMKPL